MNFARRRSLGGTGSGMAERLTICTALAVAALAIHGYHPFAEDAGVYIPAVKKLLNPSLYPHGSEIFMLPARWSAFAQVLASSSRFFHLPLAYALLFWYVACLALTLLAAWKIAQFCFNDSAHGLTASCLLAATISMPAAGCALLLCDPYLTSRSVSTPLVLFSVALVLERRYRPALLCLFAAFLFHPLMAAFGLLFLMLMFAANSPHKLRYFAIIASLSIVTALVLAATNASPVDPDYRAAVLSRSYFFLTQWAWYEWIGAIAPLILFAFLARRYRRENAAIVSLSVATIAFGTLAIAGALAITFIPRFFALARFQPMRAFHLIYVLMILLPINAGLHHLSRSWPARRRELAFTALILALSACMFTVQRQTFPYSSHIEWPWTSPQNPWQQAFRWIKNNTPKDAVFALSPNYSNDPQNDRQGFRASAERSALPDQAKDGGVAALFPQIARSWKTSTALTRDLDSINDDQAAQLLDAGVTWVVVHSDVHDNVHTDAASRLDCPYSNRVLSVCRLDNAQYMARLKSLPTHRP